ncbi:MAG: glycosidase, partial [Ignavibacteria bacterium]
MNYEPGTKELFKRYEKNPILTPTMWPYKVNSVFNAGSTIYDGKILLLVRVEDMRGFSHFSKATSSDGITKWYIYPEPALMPERENYPEEHYGIEDPRIIKLSDNNYPIGYAVVYTSFSKSGPLVSLAMTEDFVTFNRLGVIMPPDDKDASLFPRRFQGRWALIHRPTSSVGAHIWLSFSPDLIHWGNSGILIPARKGGWWDAFKIGLGPQPIETDEGWLIIYHGVRTTAAGALYRLGLALLDLDDPSKVIKRCDEWVFGPNKIYERIGDVPDVTFPCGVVVRSDELIMYYGAADTTIAVATASVKEILNFILHS